MISTYIVLSKMFFFFLILEYKSRNYEDLKLVMYTTLCKINMAIHEPLSTKKY